MSLRDEKKEFISYRNGMKWRYIAFEKQIYRTSVSEYIAKNFASKSVPFLKQQKTIRTSKTCPFRRFRRINEVIFKCLKAGKRI